MVIERTTLSTPQSFNYSTKKIKKKTKQFYLLILLDGKGFYGEFEIGNVESAWVFSVAGNVNKVCTGNFIVKYKRMGFF